MHSIKLELFVGIISLFIFFYRLTILMIPMFMKSLKERNYGQVLNSLTLLV